MVSREKDSQKGENGKVAIIGGSKEYTGAPALSAQAALRTGADLVNVLTSESVREIVAGYSENLIVGGFSADYFDTDALDQALELADWADVVVIGPGLGEPEDKAVRQFIQEAEVPLVIDADAIQHAGRSLTNNSVLTPHSGEFDAYIDGMLEEFLEKDNIVLKKGSVDEIRSVSGVEKVSAGHPGMTVGGTGDALTGIVAGLIAQGVDKKEAAVKAAKINGKAGEKAAERCGNGLVATDLLEEIPKFI
jgi:hydroxyethylthiazole kinase-like uncharacterized protein yjeF